MVQQDHGVEAGILTQTRYINCCRHLVIHFSISVLESHHYITLVLLSLLQLESYCRHVKKFAARLFTSLSVLVHGVTPVLPTNTSFALLKPKRVVPKKPLGLLTASILDGLVVGPVEHLA